MPNDAGNPVDAFGGLVVMAFDLLDSEIGRSPERLAQILKSPILVQSAEKALLSFAKSRGPFGSSQLTPEEVTKLQSSVIDGVRSAATNEYLRQIKTSTRFTALESQLKNFEKAAKSSAIGVWIDHNKNILYVVGAALTVGAGVAVFVTRPSGLAYSMGVRELEKLQFDVLKLGTLKLGVSGIIFDPTADRYGGKITGKVSWEQLKIDVSLRLVVTAAKVTAVNGEIVVNYGILNLAGIVNQDSSTQPKADLTLRLGANKDNFGLAISARLTDDDITGSASASYKFSERLRLGVDLSRRNRTDPHGELDRPMTENVIMFQLKGTFP